MQLPAACALPRAAARHAPYSTILHEQQTCKSMAPRAALRTRRILSDLLYLSLFLIKSQAFAHARRGEKANNTCGNYARQRTLPRGIIRRYYCPDATCYLQHAAAQHTLSKVSVDRGSGRIRFI